MPRTRFGMAVGSAILAMSFVLAAAAPARAQLNTQHLKGGAGLKAGSQPPPGGYIVAPLLYFYSADEVKDRNGQKPAVRRRFAQLGAVRRRLPVRLEEEGAGWNYGFQVLFPLGANNRIQGTEIDQNPGAGLTDSVIQPLSLGWHFKRADANASYLIYVPTGRYTNGAKTTPASACGVRSLASARPSI